MLTRFLSALRRFWYPFGAACWRDFEPQAVGEAPDYGPMRFHACWFNADPHWCCEPMVYIPPSDDEVIAALEKQFRKPTFRRIR